MFALRRMALQPRAAARAFSTTAIRQNGKLSSLSDVLPNAHEEFNEKQRVYREKQLRLRRERQEALKTPPGLEPSVPDPNQTESGVLPLGTYSTATDKERAKVAAMERGEVVEDDDEKEGLLQRIIYGTKEGRMSDARLEASFSRLVARGKYVHQITIHDVKPDRFEEYVDLVGKWYPNIANDPENAVHLVGSWRTEVGDCNTFVHIWEYPRYLGFHASLNRVAKDPDYKQFERDLRGTLVSTHVSLMQEFDFWPTSPPRQLGGVFELRSYHLQPGKLLEWEMNWRKGLEARRQVMEGVGAWFVQIGDLDTVHHLWQFANLEERRIRRNKSWSIDGWSDTVFQTVPLIREMKSRIMVPLPWSPVA